MTLKKTFLLLLLFFSVPIVHAYSDYVIVSGDNIGIELNSKGVIVVGFYKVNENYIAKDSGLEVGDLIVSVDNEKVDTVMQLSSMVKQSLGNIKIGYIRDNITNYTNLKLDRDSSQQFKTGIYVKDSISGIGTLTYIDPGTNIFGALGHEIVDSTNGKIFNIKSGNIYRSKVTNVEPSTNGSPGEKNATVLSDEKKGNIKENTIKGIFGNYTYPIDKSKLYKVAQSNEIKKGEAKILTVLNGTKVNEYSINILKVNSNIETKNILFEITDETLLKSTNGIIQGMSGSPIIQNNYIVGAVTHVVIDNPHRGYGILITKMLEEGEN